MKKMFFVFAIFILYLISAGCSSVQSTDLKTIVNTSNVESNTSIEINETKTPVTASMLTEHKLAEKYINMLTIQDENYYYVFDGTAIERQDKKTAKIEYITSSEGLCQMAVYQDTLYILEENQAGVEHESKISQIDLITKEKSELIKQNGFKGLRSLNQLKIDKQGNLFITKAFEDGGRSYSIYQYDEETKKFIEIVEKIQYDYYLNGDFIYYLEGEWIYYGKIEDINMITGITQKNLKTGETKLIVSTKDYKKTDPECYYVIDDFTMIDDIIYYQVTSFFIETRDENTYETYSFYDGKSELIANGGFMHSINGKLYDTSENMLLEYNPITKKSKQIAEVPDTYFNSFNIIDNYVCFGNGTEVVSIVDLLDDTLIEKK